MTISCLALKTNRSSDIADTAERRMVWLEFSFLSLRKASVKLASEVDGKLMLFLAQLASIFWLSGLACL